MSDYQQTVDLREKMEQKKRPERQVQSPLEKIYQDDRLDVKKELQQIVKPVAKQRDYSKIRFVAVGLVILFMALLGYRLLYQQKSATVAGISEKRKWYALKLVDGEIFYGQIENTSADPVVVSNVYYNYDQARQADAGQVKKNIEETGNIRLVKRGQETHGPDGSMDVVRAQILYMEPLKSDSKVLKAILEYEK